MMEEFVHNHSDSIIGIIGTLLGVGLGAIINQLSRSGELKIFPKNLDIEILKQDGYGAFEAQDKIDPDTSSVSINFSLDIQNSSSEQKNGRDIFLVIRKEGKEIKSIIKDLSTFQYTNYISRTDQFENFNIPAKTVESLKLRSHIDKKNYAWIENSTLYFEFIDTKNKSRRIKLQSKLIKH